MCVRGLRPHRHGEHRAPATQGGRRPEAGRRRSVINRFPPFLGTRGRAGVCPGMMNSRSLEVTFLESPPVPLCHLTDARLIRSSRCSPSRLPCGAGLPAYLAPAGSGDLVLPRSGTGSAERRSAHGPFREGHRVRVAGRTCLNPRLLPGRRSLMAAGPRWPQAPDGCRSPMAAGPRWPCSRSVSKQLT